MAMRHTEISSHKYLGLSFVPSFFGLMENEHVTKKFGGKTQWEMSVRNGKNARGKTIRILVVKPKKYVRVLKTKSNLTSGACFLVSRDKDMVNHPHNFLVSFLGCKWNTRLV